LGAIGWYVEAQINLVNDRRMPDAVQERFGIGIAYGGYSYFLHVGRWYYLRCLALLKSTISYFDPSQVTL